MRRKISATAATLGLMLAVAAPASAEWSGQGNSTPGIDRYNEIAANPNPEAQCGTGGGSGAFGYFGKNMNLAGGANGYQTGLNNSAVCGNRP
jgi:hypothetical protein